MPHPHYSSQAITLALLPKFTAFLSLLGSTFIFQDIACHKRKNHRVYDRLVFGLSCSDMVASVVNILSTWPIPEGTPGVYLASGTTQTCTAQGFFNELGNVATPLYNASLCFYYVLVVREGWSDEMIRKRAEPMMHIIPSVVALTISILGIPFTLYNNSGWLCWIAAYPANCQNDGTCTRGEHADTFRWVHYAIIWSAILFVTGGMYSIYSMVKTQEAYIASQLSHEHDAEEVATRGRKSKKVAIQAALFVGALYLTWAFTTITRIYQIATGHNEFALLVLMAIFFPLQGFFNALIYIRPRYLRCQSRHPDLPLRKLFKMALYPENHPIHGGNNENNYAHQHHGADAQQRRRSSTASFYSMGNNDAKKRVSEEGSSNWESDDMSHSIDTAMAKAESICPSDDSAIAMSRKSERAQLDAVNESEVPDDEFDEDDETQVVRNTERSAGK